MKPAKAISILWHRLPTPFFWTDVMRIPRSTPILGGLFMVLVGCGGGSEPAKTPAPVQQPQSAGFTFNATPPHANPLPYDAQDVAHATVTPQSYRDGAGVFVYGTCGNKRWVLLDDLIDCGHARPRSRKYRFTGVSGAQESLELFGGFTRVLYDPSFINVMKALP